MGVFAAGSWSAIVVSLVGCGARTPLLVGDASSDARDGGVDAFDSGDSDVPLDAIDSSIDGGVDVSPVACPTDLPSNGGACGPTGVVCSYHHAAPCSGGSADDLVAFRCEADGWLDVAHCVDATKCPSDTPTDGSPCDEVGLDCFYSNASACLPSGIVQCTSARGWRHVNDCGARTLETQLCQLAPSLATDAQQTLFEAKGTTADRASLRAVGTQLVTAWVLTPALGGEEELDRRVFQSAAPASAATVPFNPFGPYRGDTIASLDASHLLAAMAWGSSEATLSGAFVAVGAFDGTTAPGATHLDSRATEHAEVALTSKASASGGWDTEGWVVYRHALDAFSAARAVSIVPVDALGNPRGAIQTLTTERFDPPVPLVAPVRHAWSSVARRGSGFVLVAAVTASGDAFDDSGVGVWFIDDLTTTSLPTSPETRLPIPDFRIVVGATTAGSVTALADGSIALAFVPESATEAEPFEIHAMKRDGTQTKLPPPAGFALRPGDPHVVPFDDGFVVAWTAILPTTPDFNPGAVELSLRDASGNPVDPKPIEVSAIDLDEKKPMSITWAPDDRTLHVAWTRLSPDGTVRVMRQRMICEAATTK